MDSPFLGMVQYFAFDWAPRGYLLGNGALLGISANAALFALYGTFYGGNGTTTFAVPDLRGRSVVGQSSTLTMGERFGSPTATLLTSNMPSHTHSTSGQIAGNTALGTLPDPTGNVPAGLNGGGGRGSGASNLYNSSATAGATLGAGSPQLTVNIAGSGVAFNTQNPYLAVTACIASSGIFPSRN